MKILIVEDDAKIGKFIEDGLSELGHSVLWKSDGESALEYLLEGDSFDVIVMDLMLPKIGGLEVLERFRAAGHSTPVIILSAKRSTEERVLGLRSGADDYLVKPFSFVELETRISVLARRTKNLAQEETTITKCGVMIDLLKREVYREEVQIDLPTKEFRLLEYLMRNSERIISKNMILDRVYDYNFDTQSNIVDVLVCRLRAHLEKGFDKKLIHTVRGMGYVFKEEA